MKHRRLRETKQGLHRVLSDWRPRSTAGGSRAAAGSNRWIETAQTHTSGHHGGPRGGGDNRRTAVGWIQILTGSYGLRGGHEAPLKTPRRDSTDACRWGRGVGVASGSRLGKSRRRRKDGDAVYWELWSEMSLCWDKEFQANF